MWAALLYCSGEVRSVLQATLQRIHGWGAGRCRSKYLCQHLRSSVNQTFCSESLNNYWLRELGCVVTCLAMGMLVERKCRLGQLTCDHHVQNMIREASQPWLARLLWADVQV